MSRQRLEPLSGPVWNDQIDSVLHNIVINAIVIRKKRDSYLGTHSTFSPDKGKNPKQ
jgi:hypothetical protein